MAGDAARPHRPPLPRPAARGAADLDAREPEVLLPAATPPRPHHRLRPRRQPRHRRRRRHHPRRQRPRPHRPPRRRRVLLAERPPHPARRRWPRSSPPSPSTTSSAPRPSASPASPPSPASSPPPSAPTPTSPSARRSSPRPTSPARWSTSSPSSRAPWAATTPSRAGEDPAVAAAAEEHYAPLGPSDAVPTAPVSVAVALADKLDMLDRLLGDRREADGLEGPVRAAPRGARRHPTDLGERRSGFDAARHVCSSNDELRACLIETISSTDVGWRSAAEELSLAQPRLDRREAIDGCSSLRARQRHCGVDR